MSEKTNQKPVKCGCGGEAHVSDYKTVSGETAFYVSCRVCDTSTRSFLAKDKAITAWNKAMGADHFREVTKMMAPTAEPERKWIPVTEALPKEKEMVLITNNKGHVRCGQYRGTFADKNYRWWWKNNTLEEVLAWMPLPERWRGE